MAKPTPRLGKGLNAIIGPTPLTGPSPAREPGSQHATATIHLLPIDSISPNPRQPRTSFDDASLSELVQSVRNKGILQPLLVRQIGDGGFELVAGERRWRAAKLAALQTVPAIVRELSDSESFEIALTENLQREDLAPLERAAAYQHYLDEFGGSVQELADRIGESRANVSNYLRLLKLRPEICYMLGTGELGMGQARAIAAVSDPQRQLAIARLAARRNLSVRQVENLVRAACTAPLQERPPLPTPARQMKARHLAHIEEALSKALGLRVVVRASRKKNAGRIIIYYQSLDEFDRLAEHLKLQEYLEH